MYMHLLGILLNSTVHLSECTGQKVASIKITGKNPFYNLLLIYGYLYNLSLG